MIQGLIVLLTFQLLGECLVIATGSPVPGPVIGMLLLWLGLALKGGPSQTLETTSQWLIRYLALFFLPAGVGLFFLPEAMHQYLPAIIGTIFLATLLSMLLCAWLLKLGSRNRH